MPFKILNVNGDDVIQQMEDFTCTLEWGVIDPPPEGGDWGGYTPSHYAQAGVTPGAGAGTSGDPWNLASALDVVVAGDTLGVYAGVYVGVVTSENATDQFTPAFHAKNSGTLQDPIRIVAQFPAAQHTTPELFTDLRSGNLVDGVDSGTHGWPCFGTKLCSYVHWLGMYCDGKFADNKWRYDSAAFSMLYNTGNKVSQSRLVGYGGDVNNGGRNYAGVSCRYNYDAVITDNVMENFWSGGVTNSAGVIYYSTRNHTTDNNHVILCTHGFQPKGGSQDDKGELYGAFRNNLIEDCNHAFRFHGPGLGPNGERNPIKHNLMLNCIYIFEQTTSAGADGIPQDAMDALDYDHNTFRSDKNATEAGCANWVTTKAPPKSNVFKNSICVTGRDYWGSYRPGAQLLADHAEQSHNCIVASRYMGSPESHTLETWRANYGKEVGSITDDPLFVSAGDSRLQAGSPCIGTGEGGTTMGCYVTGNEDIGVRV
jgi:hypothetical protein